MNQKKDDSLQTSALVSQNVDFPSLDTMNVSSATDLTGLMYRPPLNEDELESYQDLYELEYSENDEGV